MSEPITEIITEVQVVFKHLPTSSQWETPWQDQSLGFNFEEITQRIENFLRSDAEVFLVAEGGFALPRIVLQQCGVTLNFRETEVVVSE